MAFLLKIAPPERFCLRHGAKSLANAARFSNTDALTGQQAGLLAPAADGPAMAGGEPRLGAGAIPLPAAGVTPVSIQVPAETRRSSEPNDLGSTPTSPHQPLVMNSLRCGDGESIQQVRGAQFAIAKWGVRDWRGWGTEVGSGVTLAERGSRRPPPCGEGSRVGDEEPGRVRWAAGSSTPTPSLPAKGREARLRASYSPPTAPDPAIRA